MRRPRSFLTTVSKSSACWGTDDAGLRSVEANVAGQIVGVMTFRAIALDDLPLLVRHLLLGRHVPSDEGQQSQPAPTTAIAEPVHFS